MERYENYKMRMVKVVYKTINLKTEEITDVIRYSIQYRNPGSFGWKWIYGLHNDICEDSFDNNEYSYGFYEEDACIKYMKMRMYAWKEALNAYDMSKAKKRLEKKLKRKYRKELKTTYQVVHECNLVDFENL